MDEPVRYALYFTPPRASKLNRFGSGVLGRDIYLTEIAAPPADLEPCLPALLEITGEPRRYGFHATLKAPFKLAPGTTRGELLSAVQEFCTHQPSIDIGPLDVTLIGAFVALAPVAAPAALGLFTAECVALFDGFRAPLSDVERTRRRPDRLSPRQKALLERWGYPYVFDEFRLHLTLTGALAADQRAIWRQRLARVWERLKVGAVSIDAVSVLCQDPPEADFRLVERIELRG